jgi:glycosyltransferase involved in cell wall biosynthesis
MRIAQVCSAFYAGGIQRHVLELCESLREKGHTVFLCGTPGPWLDEQRDETFLPLSLLDVVEEGSSTFRRITELIRSAARLRRLLVRENVELIHAHESAPAIAARLATLGLPIPIVLTYHGSEPERVGYFGRVGRWTSKLIITPSHRCARELHELGGIPKSRVNVVGLGVQPPPTIAGERVQALRSELLDPDGRILVITIARLAYQKGLDLLVEVVRRVQQQRSDIRFVVVGDGPLQEELEQEAADAGVDATLRFVGESSEPYLYLGAADLFLLTSRWEALPITIAEAFQAGVPVIATDTGGVTELVSDRVGRVTPVGDVDALVANVLELSGDATQRERMSVEALRLCKESRFSLPHVHQIIESQYSDLLASSRQDEALVR